MRVLRASVPKLPAVNSAESESLCDGKCVTETVCAFGHEHSASRRVRASTNPASSRPSFSSSLVARHNYLLRVFPPQQLDIPTTTRISAAMKPSVQEEVEDDLAAEEENKLINEVFLPLALSSEAKQCLLVWHFQEYKTWCVLRT